MPPHLFKSLDASTHVPPLLTDAELDRVAATVAQYPFHREREAHRHPHRKPTLVRSITSKKGPPPPPPPSPVAVFRNVARVIQAMLRVPGCLASFESGDLKDRRLLTLVDDAFVLTQALRRPVQRFLKRAPEAGVELCDLLGDQSILRDMPRPLATELCRMAELEACPWDAEDARVLARQGDPADRMYIVLRGVITLHRLEASPSDVERGGRGSPTRGRAPGYAMHDVVHLGRHVEDLAQLRAKESGHFTKHGTVDVTHVEDLERVANVGRRVLTLPAPWSCNEWACFRQAPNPYGIAMHPGSVVLAVPAHAYWHVLSRAPPFLPFRDLAVRLARMSPRRRSPEDTALFADLVRRHHSFERISPRVMDEMVKQLRVRQYAPGEVIFHQGDTRQEMMVLLDGEVAIFVHPTVGKGNGKSVRDGTGKGGGGRAQAGTTSPESLWHQIRHAGQVLPPTVTETTSASVSQRSASPRVTSVSSRRTTPSRRRSVASREGGGGSTRADSTTHLRGMTSASVPTTPPGVSVFPTEADVLVASAAALDNHRHDNDDHHHHHHHRGVEEGDEQMATLAAAAGDLSLGDGDGDGDDQVDGAYAGDYEWRVPFQREFLRQKRKTRTQSNAGLLAKPTPGKAITLVDGRGRSTSRVRRSKHAGKEKKMTDLTHLTPQVLDDMHHAYEKSIRARSRSRSVSPRRLDVSPPRRDRNADPTHVPARGVREETDLVMKERVVLPDHLWESLLGPRVATRGMYAPLGHGALLRSKPGRTASVVASASTTDQPTMCLVVDRAAFVSHFVPERKPVHHLSDLQRLLELPVDKRKESHDQQMVDIIKSNGLLDWADEDMLGDLCQYMRIVTANPGEVLCRQGELAEYYYLVLSGICSKHTVPTDHAFDADVYGPYGPVTSLIAERGDAGEMALLKDGYYGNTVVASEKVQLLSISASGYDILMGKMEAEAQIKRSDFILNVPGVDKWEPMRLSRLVKLFSKRTYQRGHLLNKMHAQQPPRRLTLIHRGQVRLRSLLPVGKGKKEADEDDPPRPPVMLTAEPEGKNTIGARMRVAGDLDRLAVITLLERLRDIDVAAEEAGLGIGDQRYCEVGLLGPGQVLGDIAITLGTPCPFDATAVTDVEVYEADWDALVGEFAADTDGGAARALGEAALEKLAAWVERKAAAVETLTRVTDRIRRSLYSEAAKAPLTADSPTLPLRREEGKAARMARKESQRMTMPTELEIMLGTPAPTKQWLIDQMMSSMDANFDPAL